MDLSKDNIGEFYKNNYKDLLNYSQRIGGNGFAEDAVQDNFLWALEQMRKSGQNMNQSDFQHHLYSNTKRYCRNSSKISLKGNLNDLAQSFSSR